MPPTIAVAMPMVVVGMEEDESVEENGRNWRVKKVKALDASVDAKTPTLMKASS
jgi:hypothetical protein